jgi:hypothetical protein
MKTASLLCGLGSLLALCGTAQTQISRTRNHNLNISTRGDAESCADLKVTSDGELAQASEKFTLSRAEAPTLELNAGDRGVVSVKGWKQSGYSVDVCKIAVAEDRGTADSMLRGIALTHSAGRFSYTGPTGENGTWQVHFIIHTPDTASLDLETKNAPVSIADVNGNIKVRATNGPLAIRGSMGNIDAQTTNGPISFDGEGGEVHLNAQNGPISVKVQKEIWNGSILEARTVNGPMSVSLPAVFQSGLRVEASGHAPMSCQHDLCAHAYTNWSGDQKVMQMNGSSETVRITTHNGPLSVSAPKSKKAL